MWPNPQETAVWSHLLKKYLMENFIFCAVWWKLNDLYLILQETFFQEMPYEELNLGGTSFSREIAL